MKVAVKEYKQRIKDFEHEQMVNGKQVVEVPCNHAELID